MCPLRADCTFCVPEIARAFPPGVLVHDRAEAGTDVFAPGDAWHAVLRIHDGVGAIYRRLPRDGRRIVDFVLPGEVVGVALQQGLPPVGLTALDALSYCLLPHQRLEALTESRPRLALAIWRAAAEAHDLTFDRYAHLGQQNAEARVARLLLDLCVRATRRWPVAPGTEVALPITQEHVAEATGLSAGYACRTLAELPRRGIVSYRWRRLVVIDPGALVAAAEVDADAVSQWVKRAAHDAFPRIEAR